MTYTYNFPMAAVTATGTLCLMRDWQPHILVTKRGKNVDAFPDTWCLPGGFLNVGTESVLQALVREVKEELGLDIPEDRWSLKFIDDSSKTDPRYDQVVNICYRCDIDEEEFAKALELNNNNPNNEVSEIALINSTEIVEDGTVILAFNHKEIVDKTRYSGYAMA